jgi:hypothetical protein
LLIPADKAAIRATGYKAGHQHSAPDVVLSSAATAAELIPVMIVHSFAGYVALQLCFSEIAAEYF